MGKRDNVFDLVLCALEDQEFNCDADLLREYITVSTFEGEEIGVIYFGEFVDFSPHSSYADAIDYIYLIIETVLSVVRWMDRNA